MSLKADKFFDDKSHDTVEFIKNNAINGSIKITHQQIANHLGVTRESVSKNLKQLEKNGFLTLSRGKIFLEM